jgi:hypothetical protein
MQERSNSAIPEESSSGCESRWIQLSGSVHAAAPQRGSWYDLILLEIERCAWQVDASMTSKLPRRDEDFAWEIETM